MRRRPGSLAFALLLAGTTLARGAPPAPADALRLRVDAIRAAFPGDMAVFAKDLTTGETLALDADTVYETFSVIKVPIMAEVLRQAEAGRFRLSDRVTLKAEHARIPSGVLYALDPGLQPTLKDLLTLMIIISDNAATDLLADRVGRESVTSFMARLGLPHTTIRYSDLEWDRTWLGTLDPAYRAASGDRTIDFPFARYPAARVSEAFRHVIYETDVYFGHSTAREMGRLFEMMARGELVSKPASELMLSVLKRQQVDDRFPRYLEDVEIAHKTGDGQPWIGNDAGILWIEERPLVLVVFTGRHRGSTASLHDAVARVAAAVADRFGARVDPEGLVNR